MKVWQHSFEILQSIWVWLVIGITLSAAINVWLPPSWLASISGLGIFPAMLLMLVLSIPMYVCATASVPIAAALVQGGLDPATALVFLMAGPATNITTIGAIRGRFGNLTTITYLGTLIIGSMFGAWLFSELLEANVTAEPSHNHHHANWFTQLSAAVLLLMVGQCAWQKWRQKGCSHAHKNSHATTIHVTGMHCQSCVLRLRKAIERQPHVMSAHVDLAAETVTVSGAADAQDLHRVIHDAGFSVRPL
jgi:copper chaperone CopZ